MNKLISIFTILIIALFTLSCGNNVKKPEKMTAPQEALIMEVSIGGMSCTGCEQTIQNNVGKLEGIKTVKASFTAGNAIIEYYPGIIDSVGIKDAIKGSGYQVKKCIIP